MKPFLSGIFCLATKQKLKTIHSLKVSRKAQLLDKHLIFFLHTPYPPQEFKIVKKLKTV